MILPLTIGTVLLAVSSEEDDPDRLVQFRMLHTLDPLAAWQMPFKGLPREDAEVVLKGLAERAKALFLELPQAEREGIDQVSREIGLEPLEVRLCERRGAPSPEPFWLLGSWQSRPN